MTKDTKTDTKPDIKPEADKATMIEAVYGRMVDPLTGLVYDFAPTELLKNSGWVQSQLDAGKLRLIP